MLRLRSFHGHLTTILPVFYSYLTSSGALVAANLAQLATFAILARALGPSQFGLFVQVSAATTIAVQVCGLGASDCLIRRVSRDAGAYPAMLGHNLVLIAVSGAALVVVGAAAMPLLVEVDPHPGINLLAIVLLLVSNVPLVRLILLVETAFLGHARFPEANRSVVGFAVVRTGTAGLACLVFGTSTLAQWAIWQFAGNLLYVLVCAARLRRLGPPRLTVVRDEIRPGLLFSSQFVVRAIRQNADLFFLSLVAPAAMVGSYGVARRVMDSSYLSVDALNRLVYPRFAKASAAGLHEALRDARRVLLAAVALGGATAACLFAAAPFLPLLFGRDYEDLTVFLRCLSGTIVLVAIWSVAIDLLGASGRQGARALILNGANVLGAGLIAWASWLAPPTGTFLALYATEAGIAAVAWTVLLRLARRERAASGPGRPRPDG